jgi:hypothetical protein
LKGVQASDARGDPYRAITVHQCCRNGPNSVISLNIRLRADIDPMAGRCLAGTALISIFVTGLRCYPTGTMPQRFQNRPQYYYNRRGYYYPSLAVALYNLRVQWYFVSDLNRNGFCDAHL